MPVKIKIQEEGFKMKWLKAVFNRTSEDVLKVQSYDTIGYKYLTPEQQKEWLSGLKGAWNYKDVNRLESNTKFLADLYGVQGMSFKTDWSYKDVLSKDSVQRILDNINKLRDYFKVYESTPATPDIPINTYQKVNDLEKILYDMYFVFENESLAFTRDDKIFGAELYSGDDISVI